jgi:hypothetical protein
MFRRVWVSQEFALARELSLLIGHHAFDPDFLSTVMNRLVWQEPSKRHSVTYDAYLVNHLNLLHPFVAFRTMYHLRNKRLCPRKDPLQRRAVLGAPVVISPDQFECDTRYYGHQEIKSKSSSIYRVIRSLD